MSRGPGRWQRELLAALDQRPVVSVREVTLEVTDGAATRPQHVAARSAAHRLHRVGRVRAGYAYLPDATTGRPSPHLVVVRPDDTRELVAPARAMKWASTTTAPARKRAPRGDAEAAQG